MSIMNNPMVLDVLVEARQSEMIKPTRRTGRKLFGRQH